MTSIDAQTKYGAIASHHQQDEVRTEDASSYRSTSSRAVVAPTSSHPEQDNVHTNIPVLTGAMLAAITTGGPIYAFGLYGATLKRTLHLSQSQLDTISSANFCAGLVSFLPGLCVDKLGPRLSLATGGFVGFLSLTSYWLVAREFIFVPDRLIIFTLCCLGIVVFMSNSLVIGSLFKSIIISCGPGTKGNAVGVAKGYVGLGAGAYACWFEMLKAYHENDLDFLPMAGAMAIAACTLPALCLLPSHKIMKQRRIEDVTTPRHFYVLYAGLAVLGMFVVVSSVQTLFHGHAFAKGNTLVERKPHYIRAGLMMLSWFGPIISLLFLPTQRRHHNERESVRVRLIAKERAEDELESLHEIFVADEGALEMTTSHHTPLENLGLLQVIQTAPAWLLMWTAVILVGSGTMVTNNVGQMAESLRLPSRVASASLAVFSVSQAIARVAVGALSESALTWKTDGFGIDGGVPRPVFLVVASVVGVFGQGILAYATTLGPFVVGIAFSGVAFGGVWPLMVLCIGEVFGTAHHGANYLIFDGLSSAFGTLLLSKFLVQRVYESHIDLNDPEADGITCYGSTCFQLSHLATSLLCVTSIGTSLGFLYTTREAYQRHASEHGNNI